jgi:hypothetical protein
MKKKPIKIKNHFIKKMVTENKKIRNQNSMIYWYCSGKQKGAIYRSMFARTILPFLITQKEGGANKLPLTISE